MRFGVLGPLAVWTSAGNPVQIPEIKVRALLADLLAHRGRVVSVEKLVDDLWGTDLPANPTSTLQIKVSRLRRALEQAEAGGRELVVSQAPGYVLRVDAETVDADRFLALTSRAQATEDLRDRSALLADALGLWRGEPFAELEDASFARSAITRLREERLTAIEQHAEIRLELGEHSQLVAELGALVTKYPLRQRLRAAYMRALYRSGRHSEALSSFADLREHLAEQLGLDPSGDLIALHQSMLRQAPARTTTNLPVALTRLVGRADALAQVRDLVKSGRLVTLTGPGGVGKTRLAVETARDLNGAFADGVWLIELAALGPDAQPGEVVDVIVTALGIRDDAMFGTPCEPVEQLSNALRAKQLLLVLDNCEHVIASAASLSDTLLKALPDLTILATSQDPLGVSGELLWTVPPLDLPQPGDPRQSSAVQLFAARAAPGLTLGPDNVEAVAAICRRLDGIPLALEMAATRVRTLGVHELAARLDDRFRVLTTGHRAAPARQQTLRAMIDWSWELATATERIVLRRLAVHAEGCTLAAAEEICAGDDVRPEDVLNLLARLVDRSLVVMVDSAGGPRYRLLESVRAYCVERLHNAKEFETVQARHLRYYTDFAERAEPHLYGPDQRQWLERLDNETANLRGALEVAVQLQDCGHALRLANALAWYWVLRGRLTEANRSLDLALAIGPHAQATVLRTGITLLAGGADPAVRYNAALKSYKDIDDPGMRARGQWFLGFALRRFGDQSTTTDLVNGALAEFRALEDRWGIAAALSVRATLGRAQGDLAEAKHDAETSAALFRELGDRWGELQADITLGELAEINGDYVQAVRLHEDGARMAAELGLWGEASLRLSGLARISLLTGDFTKAEELHRRAARMAAGQFDQVAEEFAEIGLALGARREGTLDIAESLLRKWLDWLRRVDGEPGLALVLAELGFIAEQRGDAAAALVLHEDGLAAARRIGDPRAVALALEGLAGAQTIASRAAELLGTATAIRESVGAPLPAAERGDVRRITARTKAELGEEAFEVHFRHGSKMAAEALR